MKGFKDLKEVTKKMRLTDSDAIVAQGRRAYHMSIELYANPFSRDFERRLWERGWNDARDKWSILLRRNGGYLGTPNSYAYSRR